MFDDCIFTLSNSISDGLFRLNYHRSLLKWDFYFYHILNSDQFYILDYYLYDSSCSELSREYVYLNSNITYWVVKDKFDGFVFIKFTNRNCIYVLSFYEKRK